MKTRAAAKTIVRTKKRVKVEASTKGAPRYLDRKWGLLPVFTQEILPASREGIVVPRPTRHIRDLVAILEDLPFDQTARGSQDAGALNGLADEKGPGGPPGATASALAHARSVRKERLRLVGRIRALAAGGCDRAESTESAVAAVHVWGPEEGEGVCLSVTK
jgi:hypothetical protein